MWELRKCFLCNTYNWNICCRWTDPLSAHRWSHILLQKSYQWPTLVNWYKLFWTNDVAWSKHFIRMAKKTQSSAITVTQNLSYTALKAANWNLINCCRLLYFAVLINSVREDISIGLGCPGTGLLNVPKELTNTRTGQGTTKCHVWHNQTWLHEFCPSAACSKAAAATCNTSLEGGRPECPATEQKDAP